MSPQSVRDAPQRRKDVRVARIEAFVPDGVLLDAVHTQFDVRVPAPVPGGRFRGIHSFE
ncbi:hypothetical protein [Rhodococcus sp. IEGM 1374]|uniref:hypothetical protein n=1 Tax=Rhodococcus sp. IEGM 1374 TaxID=3082221 RepID=UPI0029543081|nr:hypothetical protein [Rhodococcus sp. IEGM 1374]MDV7991621.1 hypothetical protein [Rhodococcus sp. IEGM 1374]